ncbi:MAG: ATP-binding cassette domain-containing protein [Oscillospiraceae bacterium]|nr:ATP-binding cassette domain-containing protein [Oscillospiraceae bacterium]
MGVILELRGLTKRFGQGEAVLEDVSLRINEGEIFGLIGKSGAGKSTLARCVNYLEEPSGGEVVFAGRELGKLPRGELYEARRSMGMVFQQFNLLMQRSVIGNVCFPMEISGWKRRAARSRALELLETVGLSDKADEYPATLSGGQRQRVAIARAIALSPRILLCDEATSALDPETTRGILALLRELNQRLGITILVITHEMLVVESICHRVAILDHSRVVEVGEVGEVFERPKTDAAKALVAGDGQAERARKIMRAIESYLDNAGLSELSAEEALRRAGIPID